MSERRRRRKKKEEDVKGVSLMADIMDHFIYEDRLMAAIARPPMHSHWRNTAYQPLR